MPWVLDDLLRQAGSSLAAELDVVSLPSACRYLWEDGTQFDAYASLPALLQSVAAIEPRDVAGFMRYLHYAHRLWDLTADTFLYAPFGWRNLVDRRLLTQAWRLDSMRTMARAVQSFFVSRQMRQVMNRFATYNGSSPYRTPATFNLIAWAEFGLGAYYPRGGMYRIAEVLTATAQRLGVEIRTHTPVRAICHQRGVVQAVETMAGERIAARAVVSNVDPLVTLRTLVGDQQRAQRLERRELACSGFVILLGIDRRYPHLDHHTILFSPDYRAEFHDTDSGRLHATPTIYINHTVHYDPQHAPVGGQNLFLLVNVPPSTQGPIDWEAVKEAYAMQIIDRLHCFGMADIRQHIVRQQILTPHDLQHLYAAPGGSIYGLASNHLLSAFLRPPQRDSQLRGLYYCGGGTHPGGGVPLALLSGMHAASLVHADLSASP
jgi:phytoene desaturase